MWLFVFAVVVITLTVCSCSIDEPNSELPGESDNGIPGEWDIGATTIYDINGSEEFIVEDTNTGYFFRFPDGGAGTLEVGNIISGPETQFEGEGIYIDFDGSDMLELLVPVKGDSFAYVTGYGSDYGSFSDENGYDDKWHGIVPVDTLDGKVAFLLMMPFQEVSKGVQRIQGTDWKGFNHYHVTQLDSYWWYVNVNSFESQVIDYVWEIIPLLTGTLKDKVITMFRKSHKPTYWFGEGNFYKGFIYTDPTWTHYLVSPRISASYDATYDNIAHETGHYMHHLIAGDAAFKTIFESIPQGDHGYPDLHDGRITIGEDYAYFFQYFLTGMVNTWDPIDPYGQFRNLTTVNVDFPSLEGFGCALLASLQRTSSTIRDQETGHSVDIPVVGASFKDIFELISYGAKNINELRVDVERYLRGPDGTGPADKLPVILHRLGWRYMGHVKIVNQDGDPMPNVEVKFVAKVTGSPDYVEAGYTSDSDGNVTFTRCFGGNTFIRVFHDGKSTDVPINIDWSHATNVPVELGEIKIEAIETLPFFESISMNYIGEHIYTDASAPNDIVPAAPPGGIISFSTATWYPDLQWTGKIFYLEDNSDSPGNHYHIKVDGQISEDGSTLISLDYKFSGGGTDTFYDQEYHISNVNFIGIDPYGSYTYGCSGAEAESKTTITKWYYHMDGSSTLITMLDYTYVTTTSSPNTKLEIKLKP